MPDSGYVPAKTFWWIVGVQNSLFAAVVTAATIYSQVIVDRQIENRTELRVLQREYALTSTQTIDQMKDVLARLTDMRIEQAKRSASCATP